MFSTIVNCTILQVCQKMRRIEMLSKIMDYFKNFSDKVIHFPRTRFMNASFEKQTKEYDEIKKFEEPVTLNSIKKVINQAKQDAFDECTKLNMIIDISNADYIQTDYSKDADSEDEDEHVDDSKVSAQSYEKSDDEDDFVDDVVPTELESFAALDKEGQFPLCLEEYKSISTKDSVVAVKNPRSGKVTFVKKTSLCWFFNNHRKLSSDRTLRVRESDFITPSPHGNISVISDIIQELETISIGDFCLFQIPNKPYLLIALVKSFANMKERTWKKFVYKKESIVLSEANSNTGIAAAWFEVNSADRSLQVFNPGVGYISVSNYRKTIPVPEIIDGKRSQISFSVYNSIKNEVKIL